MKIKVKKIVAYKNSAGEISEDKQEVITKEAMNKMHTLLVKEGCDDNTAEKILDWIDECSEDFKKYIKIVYGK